MEFVKESRIAAPPERVFAFHESPGALVRITPPWERVEVVEDPGSLAVGGRVVIRTWMGPLPVRWVAEFVAYDPPHLFADRQVSGPFASWLHRHRFLDDGQGGTILRDEVEYEPPGGWLGRLVGGPLIGARLRRMFDYRHEATTRAVLGVESPGAAVAPAAGAGRPSRSV